MKTLLLAALLTGATPEEIVKKVDAILAPETYRAKVEMVTHRTDNTEHTYRFEMFKSGRDKVRVNFSYPADQAGNQMLRSGDNEWMYLTNLKRSMRIASRQQLMGGDFNNGDVLRLNLVDDYNPSILKEDDTTWILELKARTDDVTYDRIELKIEKKGFIPVEQKIYTLSGKHIKTLYYENPKVFAGLRRPSKLRMVDELTGAARWSIIEYKDLFPDAKLSDAMFSQNQLGR